MALWVLVSVNPMERESRLREQIRKDALGMIIQDRWQIFVEKFLLGYSL
ncbi:hypothetical protein ALO79_03720 [Pseudomonas syringae pv. castaneae]|nr:hypothetical protein ALO79_03720 [Pseudomonas syringae pv. castaneae]